MRLVPLTVILVISLILGACAAPPPLVSQPAPAGEQPAVSDQLIVYSSVDEENARKLLDAFSAETGIDVEMVFHVQSPRRGTSRPRAARPGLRGADRLLTGRPA